MVSQNKHQQVQRMNSKVRYKSYKVGKHWVVACIASFAIGSGLFFQSELKSYAATTGEAGTTAVTSTPTAATAAGETQSATPATTTTDTASDVNTAALKDTSSEIQSTVDTAKSTGVAVTTNPAKTVTTTPDKLADTVASVKADYDQQAAAIQTATDTQTANNAAYDKAKAAYDSNQVEIKATAGGWTDAQLVKLLTGKGANDKTDVTNAVADDVTDADLLAASDEAKKAAQINVKAGTVVTDENGNPVKMNQVVHFSDNASPSWKYNSVFLDPATGKWIDAVETITGYVAAKDAKGQVLADQYIEIYTDNIGFNPHNIQDVSASIKYYYAGTDETANIDAIVGFRDLDALQGISIDNDYATILRGSQIAVDQNGVDRSTNTAGVESWMAVGQVWALQKNVSETDYTFYGQVKSNGTTENLQPVQFIGGIAFSIVVPDSPVKKIETAEYTPTTIQVTTYNTINYQGAGTVTPTAVTSPVTWTGSYDATTDSYTWTPDQSTISVASPVIDGYSVSPQTATWHLTAITTDPADESLTVSYYPTPTVSEKTALTVHYVDEKGNSLQTATTQTGESGKSFTITPPQIEGYWINTAPINDTYHGNAMSVTLTYQKYGELPENTTTILDIHYVDQANQTIAPTVNQTGKVGETFDIKAPTIAGYRLKSGSQPAVVDTYRGNHMTVTFVYQKYDVAINPASQLVTKFVDQDGQPIKEATTKSGKVGDTFTTEAPSIDGYRLKGQPSVSVTLKGNRMIVTFVYQQLGQMPTNSASQLVIHYVDEAGKTIHDDTIEKGEIGAPFTATAQSIDGYQLLSNDQVAGTYKGDQMVVTFTYRQLGTLMNKTSSQLVTRYIDEAGHAIQPELTQTGTQGEAFTATAPDIANYRLLSQPTITGTYHGDTMTATFIYQQLGQVAVNEQTNLVIHCIDTSGHLISPDTTQTGITGTDFSVHAVTVPGYVVVAQDTVTGQYQGNQMQLTFVYQKVTASVPEDDKTTDKTPTETQPSLTPETENAETTPSSETAPATGPTTATQPGTTEVDSDTTNHQKSNVSSPEPTTTSNAQATVGDQKLPQTSEQTNLVSLIGLGLLGLLSSFGFVNKKRRQD